ncbi:DUF3343 domain-containing protein [candidate division WOR-3 bacterium]|nr:DUF3343 domain-containing protein [candidate division WOR-3 bacterium]
MPENKEFGVVLFFSAASAFKLEKRLKSKNISHKLIPVPRHLDSDCGTSLRFFWQDYDSVVEEIKTGEIEVKIVSKL